MLDNKNCIHIHIHVWNIWICLLYGIVYSVFTFFHFCFYLRFATPLWRKITHITEYELSVCVNAFKGSSNNLCANVLKQIQFFSSQYCCSLFVNSFCRFYVCVRAILRVCFVSKRYETWFVIFFSFRVSLSFS